MKRNVKIGLKCSDEVLRSALNLWHRHNSLLNKRTSLPSSSKFNFEYINLPVDLRTIRIKVNKDNPLFSLPDKYWIEDMKRLIKRREEIIWNKIMTESYLKIKLNEIDNGNSNVVLKEMVEENIVVLNNYIEDLDTIRDGEIIIMLNITCGVYTGIEIK